MIFTLLKKKSYYRKKAFGFDWAIFVSSFVEDIVIGYNTH